MNFIDIYSSFILLLGVLVMAALVYVIIKRIQDRSEEDFEQRDH